MMDILVPITEYSIANACKSCGVMGSKETWLVPVVRIRQDLPCHSQDLVIMCHQYYLQAEHSMAAQKLQTFSEDIMGDTG